MVYFFCVRTGALNVIRQRMACLHIGFREVAANLYLALRVLIRDEELEFGMHLIIPIASASNSRSFPDFLSSLRKLDLQIVIPQG